MRFPLRTTPSHRMLAVALLATTLATLYTLAIDPVITRYVENHDKLESLRLDQIKLRELIRQAQLTTRSPNTRDSPSPYLSSSTLDDAVAQGQQWLRTQTERAGIALSSLSASVITDDPVLSTVTLQAQFAAPFSQSQRFFHGLESDQIAARIERLSIRPSAAAANSVIQGEQVVDVQLDIVTWHPHNE
jgi:Type II secretion system (T2SS), protein M subtype b